MSLDTLHHHGEPKLRAEAGHTAQQLRRLLVRGDVADEGAVDLHLVQREFVQIAEARIASSEVVQRQSDTHGTQLVQDVQDGSRILEQQGFGDLELETVGRQAGRPQRVADQLHHVVALELDGRQVDGHAHRLRPARAGLAGLAHDLPPELDDKAGFLRHRDELGGRHHAPDRMRPADQRLAGGDRQGLQVEQRLEVDSELVVLEGLTQVHLDGTARLRAAVHLFLVEVQDAFAAGLGATERHVGALQQLVGIAAIARRQGDSDRSAADDRLVIDLGDRGQGFDDPRRQAGHLVDGPAAVLEHHELVGAEARHDVAVTNREAQPVRDLHEDRVARRVAQRVVDLLEVVEIDEQHREEVVAAGHGQGGIQPLLEQQPVRQAGQRIVPGHMGQPGFRAPLLGNVLDRNHEATRFHRLERQVDVPVIGLKLHLLRVQAEATPPDDVEHPARIALAEHVQIDIGRDDGLRARARGHAVAVDRHDLEPAPVDDHEAAVGIEHGKAVRHVVQRRVEPVRQQRDLALRDDGVEQDVAQAPRDTPDAAEEGQREAGEDEIVPHPGHDHAEDQRRAEQHDLVIDEPAVGEIPPGDTDHVGQRHRHAEEMRRHAGRKGERGETPQADGEDQRVGAERVLALPAPRLFVGDDLTTNPLILLHPQGPDRGDEEHHERKDDEQGVSGQIGDIEAAGERRGSAEQKGAHVLVKSIDHRDIDLGGQLSFRLARASTLNTHHLVNEPSTSIQNRSLGTEANQKKLAYQLIAGRWLQTIDPIDRYMTAITSSTRADSRAGAVGKSAAIHRRLTSARIAPICG
ncbi:MAG: hypothetical protein FD152_1688, partial [Xanthobacteraceae bacterium]